MRRFKARWILKAVVFVALAATLLSWAVMALWNYLLPGLFGWPMLRWPQALALLVLCRLLFGRFGRRGGGGWQQRGMMMQHWAKMSPEERDRMRQQWRGSWCRPSSDEPSSLS